MRLIRGAKHAMQVVQQPGYMAVMGQKPCMEWLPHQSYKDNVLTCVSNLPMKSIRHMIFLLPFTDNIMEVQTRSPAKSALWDVIECNWVLSDTSPTSVTTTFPASCSWSPDLLYLCPTLNMWMVHLSICTRWKPSVLLGGFKQRAK